MPRKIGITDLIQMAIRISRGPKAHPVDASYQQVRSLVQTRSGGSGDLIDALEMVEARPDSASRRAFLAEELKRIRPLQDPELKAALLALRDEILRTKQGEGLIRSLSAGGGSALAAGTKARAVGGRGAMVGGSVGGSVQTGDGNVAIEKLVVKVTKAVTRALPGLGAADVRDVTPRYLTHLIETYRFLDFRGMGVTDRVALRLPLLNMYLPLKARLEMPEGDAWERLRVAGRKGGAEEAEAAGERLGKPLPVLDLLQKHDGLILLGDPGAGKTTFIKYLTLMLAMGRGKKLGLGHRLPVLVPLSAYAQALEIGDQPLDRFIDTHYRNRGVDLPLAALLAAALKQGTALVLLDGLDEVHAMAHRRTVVNRVTEFFNFHRQAGNKFVLTSRIVGYREVRPNVEGLVEGTLIDFDDEEIAAFVDRWTTALEQAAYAAADTAAYAAAREKADLLAALERNPGVRALAANPLLLTILALMKRQGISLPERRVQLYETYVETLLRQWNLARGLDRSAGRELDVIETLRVLAPLALWMHTESPGKGLVKGGRLRRRLEGIFQERGDTDPEAAARRFLEDVRGHAALLLERGAGMYGFIHLTFQEYLAAVAVARLGQTEVAPVVERLMARADDDTWTEVSRLTVAYMGIIEGRDKAAGEVMEALIGQESDQPGRTAVLAGRALQDAWPGGVTPESRKAVVAALVGTLGRSGEAPPAVRSAAGVVLGRVGDPRREIMSVEGMLFCHVPEGAFWMGSDKKVDPDAGDGETPRHCVTLPGFFMAKYPVTQAQFAEFVVNGGYKNECFWPKAIQERFWKDGKFKGGYDNEWRANPLPIGHPFDLPNHPVVGVTWYEALAFCRWLTAKWRRDKVIPENWLLVLPSEAEWEKAARGGERIPENPVILTAGEAARMTVVGPMRCNDSTGIRPWGESREIDFANVEETGIGSTTTPGSFSAGCSPYGCVEMIGNAWEWMRSRYSHYPYDRDDGREDAKSVKSSTGLALRGGAFGWKWDNARCAYRDWDFPNGHGRDFGFRVALLPML